VNAEQEERRLQDDLRFFGRITARTTHQLNNIFSIVTEFNGLLEDLAQMVAAGRPLPPGKLEDVAGRCQRNVVRGVEYVDKLNAFAHAVDDLEGNVEIAEAAQVATALTRRAAELQRVALSCQAAGSAPAIRTRPFRLLRAICLAIEAALLDREQGGEISVQSGPAAGGAAITITSSAPLASGPRLEEVLSEVRELMTELGGRLVADPPPGRALQLVLAEQAAGDRLG
jgi:hypothetical protein